MTETETMPSPDAPAAVARATAVARRIPFTVAVVAATLVIAVALGTLWSPLRDRALLDSVAYGLPAFRDGRWWTVATGAFFALTPLEYLLVLGGSAVLLGWSEWRLGTPKVVLASVCCHLVGVVGAALLLLALSGTGWDWAVRVSKALDAGFTTAALGALAAASVTLVPPWRGRLRFALSLYAVLAVLYIGLLRDLEHVLAVGSGLLLGPFLVGARPAPHRPRLTRHEWRLLASSLFLVGAVVRLILWFFPSDGPLGATTTDTSTATVLVGAGVSLLLAYSLRKGSHRAWQWAIGLVALVVTLVLVAITAAVLGPEQLAAGSTTQAVSAAPALVVDLVMWVVQAVVLVAGRSAFLGRRARSAGATAGATDREIAVALLREHGGTTMSWMGTWPDNRWYIHRGPDGEPDGYVAHQVHRGVAIALGDPVAADPEARAVVLDAFVDDQQREGRGFCLFSVTPEVTAWGRSRGLRDVQVAEEAIIDLPGLEFTGKHWQTVRSALNRAAKEEITYREGRLAEMPRGLIAQVRAISELWVSDKGLPEMAFTLGGVDEALDPDTVVGLAVDRDQTVHGVTSWLPVLSPGGRPRGWTLDVVRRLPDGFRPVTEFMIASACLSFREQGAVLVSLSGAPLARSGGASAERAALDRLLDGLGEALEPLYGFRSLAAFKAKFQPRHEPVHLVYPDEAALPRIGLALTSAYLPGATIKDLAVASLKAVRHDEAG